MMIAWISIIVIDEEDFYSCLIFKLFTLSPPPLSLVVVALLFSSLGGSSLVVPVIRLGEKVVDPRREETGDGT